MLNHGFYVILGHIFYATVLSTHDECCYRFDSIDSIFYCVFAPVIMSQIRGSEAEWPSDKVLSILSLPCSCDVIIRLRMPLKLGRYFLNSPVVINPSCAILGSVTESKNWPLHCIIQKMIAFQF